MADALSQAGVPYSAVDCDFENAGKPGALHLYLPSAARYDIRSVSDLDELIGAAASSEADVTLVDLPANAGGDFLAWAGEALSSDILRELGLRATALGVVTREPASLASLLSWTEALRDDVSYAAALNRRHAERVEAPGEVVFAEYFKCGFREAASPVAEIEIPGLYEDAANKMQAYSVLPSRVGDEKRIDPLNRARIRRFGEKIRLAWAAALPALLGETSKKKGGTK